MMEFVNGDIVRDVEHNEEFVYDEKVDKYAVTSCPGRFVLIRKGV